MDKFSYVGCVYVGYHWFLICCFSVARNLLENVLGTGMVVRDVRKSLLHVFLWGCSMRVLKTFICAVGSRCRTCYVMMRFIL